MITTEWTGPDWSLQQSLLPSFLTCLLPWIGNGMVYVTMLYWWCCHTLLCVIIPLIDVDLSSFWSCRW